MAITARLRPVFCVFGPKISRTFYFKLTEQSSREKLAVGGFEPEKVRLLYPAPWRSKLCIACSDFSAQKSERAHAAAPPFRKKSRSAHLLGCKRPRNGLLSLPTFCGFKSKSVFRYGIFFATSSQLIRLENVSFGSFLALGTSKWKEHILYWFSRLFSSICARNPADASCAAGFLGRTNDRANIVYIDSAYCKTNRLSALELS